MPRKIEVEITGNAKPLEQAFGQAERSARQFQSGLRSSASSFDPLLQDVRRMRQEADQLDRRMGEIGADARSRQQSLVATGAKTVAVAYALSQGLSGAAVASKYLTGENSQLTRGLGDAAQGISSLLTLDIGGFFDATQAGAQRSRKALADYDAGLKDANQSTQALKVATAAEAAGFDDAADAIRRHVALLNAAQAGTDALAFSQRQYNETVIDGTTYLVQYKGAHDAAMNPTGAPQVYGGTTTTTKGRPTQGLFLTPSERRNNALIGLEGVARIPLLQDAIRQWQGQLEKGVKTHETYARISRNIATTEAEIARIYKEQAATDKANAARREAERKKRAAEAAAAARKARELAAEREQARQFRLIGLSASGGEIVPTEANLRKQLAGLSARDDIPAKLRNRFAGIRKALAEPGGLTDKTREAIRDFFRMVRQEINKGEQDSEIGPYAQRGLNTASIVRGLALTAAQKNALRDRLAGFNVSGKALNPGRGMGAYGSWVTSGGGTSPVTIPVYLDGQKVGSSVKRYSQRDAIHSPKQKRGPNAGR